VKGKKIIYNVVILLAWLLVGSGMIILLAAANKKQKQHLCRDVVVTIKGKGDKFFIEKTDIFKQFQKSGNSEIQNKPINGINLSKLENSLKHHSWIKEAQLYFDSRNVLHVLVIERIPIARVFTMNGQSFYIDSEAQRMPLLDKVNVRLPVITNFSNAKKLSATDRFLLKDISSLIQYLGKDSFWSAQIAQIDITPQKTLEALPVVGNHIIRLGSAKNIEKKLDNLLLFYQQVLSKTGFDKYKAIDLQYDGQIIGVQKGLMSRIDSLQLKKNIEILMKESQAALADSLLHESSTANNNIEKTSTSRPETKPIVISGKMSSAVKTKSNPKIETTKPYANPNAVKTKSKPVVKKSIPSEKKKNIAKKDARIPKAVMKKTN
jgi:cell division protein FtsQ